MDPDVFANGDPARNGLPHDAYAWMRANAPCMRQQVNDPNLLPWTWVVTRYDDVVAIDRDHRRFVSGQGVTMRTMEPTLPSSGGKETMITMDGADHIRNRRIVARGFSPSVIRTFERRFREMCTHILDDALAKGSVDFVTDIATELPLQAICELMGVPAEDQQQILRWSNTFSVATDPDYSPSLDAVFEAIGGIWNYGLELAAKRRLEPREDMMSKVAAAQEAEQLSDNETMGMMLLMAGAGNETTRNALSHGLHGLLAHPEQMAMLRSNPGAMDSAVEEILRWSSPVVGFRRTAAEPMELHGQQIAPGDRVWIVYTSANFDPDVFREPERFDLTRSPNPHVAFGTGPHVCMGAAVARLEIKIMMEELLARTADIRQIGPIQYARDSFLRGVKHLPVELVPT